jgi:SAM-dependent methyltransferase
MNARCRLCDSPLEETFADLGMSPLANAYVRPERLDAMEPFYPLHAYVCSKCFLVQLEEFEAPDRIFSDYAYFSSYSSAWLEHCRAYAERMIDAFALTPDSLVMEIASNDGYLLQFFAGAGIPVLGIEPAANVAEVAIAKGVPTRAVFFGTGTASELVREGMQADLLAANNVLAHVPDLHGFIEGMRIALKPHGIITVEFPHLLELIRHVQFDTIYHEHFSYLSLGVVEQAFARHGLAIFRVDRLPTHGGSLRIYAKHAENDRPVDASVEAVRRCEHEAGLRDLDTYRSFAERVKDVKCDLLDFLIEARRNGKTVAGYGAPAKGNTLLNYCGIGRELLPYTVDRSPHKQGLYLPGTHIPVRDPETIRQTRPDYVLILPWNLREEIADQMSFIRDWGAEFVTPVPRVEVF